MTQPGDRLLERARQVERPAKIPATEGQEREIRARQLAVALRHVGLDHLVEHRVTGGDGQDVHAVGTGGSCELLGVPRRERKSTISLVSSKRRRAASTRATWPSAAPSCARGSSRTRTRGEDDDETGAIEVPGANIEQS